MHFCDRPHIEPLSVNLGKANVVQLTLRSFWETWKMSILMIPLSFYDELSRIVARLPDIACQLLWMKLLYHAYTVNQLQGLVLTLTWELLTKGNLNNCLDKSLLLRNVPLHAPTKSRYYLRR